MDRSLAEGAASLVAAAEVDAKSVLEEATSLAGQSGAGPWVRSVALRAAAIAARTMERFDEAERYFEAAILTANRAGAADAEGEAYISRAGLRALTDRFDDALADLDRADALLDDHAAAHVAVQRANVVHQAGDFQRAEQLYEEALALCRHHELLVEEARILSNRSLLLIERGAYDDAHASLLRTSSILRATNQHEAFLPVAHNLGYLALCRGHIPEAVAHLDAHRRAALAAGANPYAASADLAEALLVAGLAADSERESLAAARHFEDRRALTAASHAYVAAGRAALVAGRAADAVRHVHHGLTVGPSDGRAIWRAVHEAVLVEARLADGAIDEQEEEELTTAISTAVAALRQAGMTRHEHRARLVEANLAIGTGRNDDARQVLDDLAGARDLSLQHRCERWRLVGLLEQNEGEPGRALRAFGHAMAVANEIRRSVQWVETAASAGPLQTLIGTEGLRATLAASARPGQLLRWMEAAYQTTPVDRPSVLRSTLIDVALTTARRAAYELADRINNDGTTADLVAAAQRQASAEDDATRAVRSSGVAGSASRLTDRSLRADLRRLHTHQLLEIAEVDGNLHAVTATDGRLRRHRLGTVDAAQALTSTIRALVRASWQRGGAPDEMAAYLQQIDNLVIPNLVRDRRCPLVIVPSVGLSALPFGLLPSLRHRPFTCAPSLSDHVARRPKRSQDAGPIKGLFVAGPGLSFADEEVASAAASYADNVVLRGNDAIAERLLNELDADVLHVACHGTVRHDAPLFSALHLNDGPLAINALFQSNGLPRLVVLSACEVGRPIRDGGRALVLPTALLTLGAEVVVASSVSVPDEATVDPMVTLHRLLANDYSVADSLVELRTTGTPLSQLVAATFIAHCRGTQPVAVSKAW